MCLTNNLLIVLSLTLRFNPGVDAQNSDSIEPDFCSETKLDSAFSDQTNQIRLIKNQWIWTYIENKEIMSLPAKQKEQKYKLQSILYISAVPHCQVEDLNCRDIQKAKDLLIMFYKMRTKSFAGAYQVKKVIDGVVTRLTADSDLPFGLRAKGNLFSSEETFWAKHLIAFDSFDRRHTILVYNPFTYELIIISNAHYPYGWLCFNTFQTSKDWRDGWKCGPALNDWKYIGAFVRNSNVYVLAIKKNNNRLFTISKDHDLIDTNINVQKYFDCNPLERRASVEKLSDKESESSNTSVWIWIIVGVVIALIIILIFGLIVFCGTQIVNEKSKSQKSKPSKHTTNLKPTPKAVVNKDKKDKQNKKNHNKMLDNRGKEVGKDKIGALDSEVNWDIVVAQPSKASAPKSTSSVDTQHYNSKT